MNNRIGIVGRVALMGVWFAAVGCKDDETPPDPVPWDTHTSVSTDSSTSSGTDSATTDGDTDSDTDIPLLCEKDGDCDDRNPCTIDFCDELSGRCDYTNFEVDGQPCDDGKFCNGPETCQSGECISGQAPCADVSPQPGSCIAPGVCDEDIKACKDGPVTDGTSCGDPEFCLGNQPKTCVSGICRNPENALAACMISCHSMQCREATEDCRRMVDRTGQYCYDDDPCERGICEASGTCGNKADPCVQQYGTPACFTADCAPAPDGSVNPWRCDITPEANLTLCGVSGNACYGGGSGSYCYETPDNPACIPGPTRPCLGSDLSDVQVCTPNYEVAGTYTCPDLDPQITPRAVACGISEHPSPNPFRTREYYTYGASCAGNFPGMEAAFRLTGLSVGQTVTITTDQLPPGYTLTLLRLTDYANPSSCVQLGTGSLTFMASDASVDFIAEAGPGYPPSSFRLSISCN